MATHGVSGDLKPKRMQDHFGSNVEVTVEDAPDGWASKMLTEIGKTTTQQGHEYLGSVAVHYYRAGDITGRMDLIFRNQMNLDDISEGATLAGITNLGTEVMKLFGRTHKTTDSKDKR